MDIKGIYQKINILVPSVKPFIVWNVRKELKKIGNRV